jgi:hypothetical protein
LIQAAAQALHLLQFKTRRRISAAMDQEIIKPEAEPKASAQGFSPFGSTLAAVGATLLMLCFTGSAMVATVWAFAKLIGVPDLVMYGVMALGVIPVVWSTVWTAGRAWHVERLLAQHKDIDTPVFSMMHYFKKR